MNYEQGTEICDIQNRDDVLFFPGSSRCDFLDQTGCFLYYTGNKLFKEHEV
jgi:hypothetical protein